MSISQTIYRRRDAGFVLEIFDEEGALVPFDVAADRFRVKIGGAPGTPALDLTSAAPSAGNSSVSASNGATVLLSAADADLSPGFYDIEAMIVDDSDDDKIKAGDKGVLHVIDTQAGNTD